MDMLVLGATLALVIGVVLGMLGGGGAILTLPMLVYVLDVEPRAAIATSLFVVGVTALVSLFFHARRGHVRYRVGALFGAAAMVGAFAGGRLAHFVPEEVLLVVFGATMVVTAIFMLRGRGEAPADRRELRVERALLLGFAVGCFAGLVGAGGGFLIVPALVLFGGLAMREAVATSLFVITLQSFAGFAGHAAHAHLDPVLVASVTACAALGSVAGALLGKRVSPENLRRVFAWLVVAMGLFMLGKQLPLPLLVLVAALALGVITRPWAAGLPGRPAER
ncbi:sulfite exporter TauE/SafE family protein [Polyangium sp. 6x1]|uniref:sulfite exporter TauE/SafE family protein n=1 Tax=Polyangium sp. 6x1 TaxID=3042689 RepID=UPI0024831B17|nr:sulfite exporter TauE/SafE family protein [Polyangium sp. 6x1]MDI1449787.1 sulfite exporter TauE/SafE family protein [Polyangium sp. 6x1]